MTSLDSENKQSLRMHGWLLAVRLTVVAVGISLIPDIQVPLATLLGGLLAVTVIVVLLLQRTCWLPYCFLGAAALWAGYGAGLAFYSDVDPALLFVACLIVVDAALFITSWGRRWL